MLKYLRLYGKDIQFYASDLAELRIEVFRSYPYLYDGDKAYEKEYLATYADSEESFLALVKDGDKVVGATTAIPLQQEVSELRAPFEEKSLSLENVMYFGESVLLKDYRGRGVGKRFFELREEHAQKVFPELKLTCFCAVERPTDHPLKPPGYEPLDPFWESRGYTKRPDLQAQFSWHDIDQSQETSKTMTYWTKSW